MPVSAVWLRRPKNMIALIHKQAALDGYTQAALQAQGLNKEASARPVAELRILKGAAFDGYLAANAMHKLAASNTPAAAMAQAPAADTSIAQKQLELQREKERTKQRQLEMQQSQLEHSQGLEQSANDMENEQRKLAIAQQQASLQPSAPAPVTLPPVADEMPGTGGAEVPTDMAQKIASVALLRRLAKA